MSCPIKMKIRRLPSDPEILKRLAETYGEAAQTLEVATSWDHCVLPEEKFLGQELRKERAGQDQCPFLELKGEYFNFCGAKAKRLAVKGLTSLGDKIPSHKSAEYRARLGHLSLQYWCLRDKCEYKTCIDFPSNGLK
jgi:hypothetical protein